MNTTEIAANGAIRDLFTAKGPCVTIALAGTEAGDIGTELKNAIQQVRES